MRDRELEIQSDARDKQREMEEIEEVLRKQMAGETIEPKHKRVSEEVEVRVYLIFCLNCLKDLFYVAYTIFIKKQLDLCIASCLMAV